VELAVGDSLLAFTDGVLDLYDGTLQSLARAVDLARDSDDTAAFLQALRALAASGSASDDITALVLTRTGADRSAEKDSA
jgi:serine/threonine protein phosphatase PrpC